MADPHGSLDQPDPHRRQDTSGDRSQVALVPENPDRFRVGSGIRWLMIAIVWAVLVLAAAAGTAVYVMTNTDWGRERVRRYAENFLNAHIHGQAKIGRLSGNLLTGVTVHDFSIVDTLGKPFIAVEKARGKYWIIPLFKKHLWFYDVVATHPIVVLDRPPDQAWNWKGIFPRETTPKPPSEQTEWGDWLRFTSGAIIGGQLIVRSPWKPSSILAPAARDSAIREAIQGRGRLLIQRVPGGFQKIVQLDSVTAAIPFLRLSEPGYEDRLLEVSAARMKAYPFRPPAAIVRDLKGVFPFNNDSIWWSRAYAAFPSSKVNGDGVYNFDSGDLALTLHTNSSRFADMRWVYPRLPANGRGRFDLALTWRGAIQDFQFTNADVTMDGGRSWGSLGLTFADTLTIHNTNLRFANADTRTLEQLIPGFTSPRRGRLTGRAKMSGGRNMLDVDTDVTFDDPRAGRSRVIAVGGVGFPVVGLRARDLRVRMLPFQVDMARTWFPTLAISGTVRGSATFNGNTTREIRISSADIEHRDDGSYSALTGATTIRLSPSGRVSWFDVDVVTRPIALAEVGRFLPSLGLRGVASGPIHVTGTLADMRLNVNLRTPDGGRLVARGTLAPAGRETAYNLTAQLSTFNLRRLTTKGPPTSLTALAVARGHGFTPETMRMTVAAELSTSRWDTVGVDTASIRVNIGNGLADVERLLVSGPSVQVTLAGSFGLARDRAGTLSYRVTIDSLGALERWIPRDTLPKRAIAPRPGAVARAMRRARADSARRDRSTEIERLITGAPPPKLVVNRPRTVPSDTLAGMLFAAGTLTGNIFDFDVRGRAAGKNIAYRGNIVGAFKSEYAWNDARSATSRVAIAVDADSVSVMGFVFDTAKVRFTYKEPGGHIEVAIVQDPLRQYTAKGDYALSPDRKELRLADMSFKFDTVFWSLTRPSLIQWGRPGIRVNDFELRNARAGRIYANGLLPTNGTADFELDVARFPISNIVDITQTDVEASGVLSLHASMRGTLRSPAFRGAIGVVKGTYNGTTVPDFRATFEYANQLLVTQGEALRATGEAIATIDGHIPINLALSGVTGDRLLPRPMAVDIVADSLPLDLLPQFTNLVSNVHGHAAGKVAIRGTLRRPELVGALTVDDASMTISSTGATIENITATAHMASDTVYVDSVAGWAKGPVRVRGTLAVGSWREPTFNLFLVAENAELWHNDHGTARVDAGVSLTGPFRQAYMSGAVTVTQGVIYAPEPSGRHVIGAGDPALFNVLDTAIAAERELFPPPSPFLANLRMELTLSVRRNTWVRNREANIEIYTDDPMFIRAEQQSLALTGVIATERGEYRFLSKRFQIKRGAAIFIGTPDLNPTLQITGEYQVQTASRGAVNITVRIGGTLRQPRLALESDAQPPKTQSELLSLLAFGQTTTSLLASGSSSIAGSAATADLFGVGAQVAVRRLAGVALGTAVQEIEMEAGRAFGTDVFDITPSDVPSGNFILSFFQQTKFEAGKYVNPRTFLSVQYQAYRPGIAIEHRTLNGWRFNAAIEPRLLLSEPRLNEQPIRTVRSYGGFIAREWRF
ncbi:MAG TPA: translocation/assembly module TamB domain-containing protein [Gemmatimonadaceae bacterium]